MIKLCTTVNTYLTGKLSCLCSSNACRPLSVPLVTAEALTINSVVPCSPAESDMAILHPLHGKDLSLMHIPQSPALVLARGRYLGQMVFWKSSMTTASRYSRETKVENGITWQCGCKGHVVVPQSLSCVRLFANPWTAARQASLSSTFSQSLLKFMLSNHLILCRPFLLLPAELCLILDCDWVPGALRTH